MAFFPSGVVSHKYRAIKRGATPLMSDCATPPILLGDLINGRGEELTRFGGHHKPSGELIRGVVPRFIINIFFGHNAGGEGRTVYALLLFLSICLLGCAKAKLTPVQRADLDQRAIVEITEALATLPSSEKLSPLAPELVQKEARMIATALVDQTRETNKKFRMTTTPNWHNIFIKWGLREEGYCYHWVPELMKALPPYPLKVFERHWGVAYKKLDENNAVLITKRGSPIATGIVYDAWRGSGRPCWKTVAVDKKYRWEVRFREDQILRGEARVSPKNSKDAD